jgi:hypothetical protein
MMCPNSKDDGTIMQYDSVHQLKNLVKKYYIKKGQMTEKLLKKLDNIAVERPKNLEKCIEYFMDPNKPPPTEQAPAEDNIKTHPPHHPSFVAEDLEDLSLSGESDESDDSPTN